MRAPDFATLGLRTELLRALDRLDYESPTPIQNEAIPVLLGGADLLGQAATGTGKTAAFALPLLHRLDAGGGRGPAAVVLVPTRELARQVSNAIRSYGEEMDARVAIVCGGQRLDRQVQVLRRGCDVVVATPGRAVDLLDRGALDLESVRCVVLDEADEMLDLGFAEDLGTILDAAPGDRQTVMFSATMPRDIRRLAQSHLTDPVVIDVTDATSEERNERVGEHVYYAFRNERDRAISRILGHLDPAAAILFCRTRAEVDDLAAVLQGRGHRVEALHGGMDQSERDRVMSRMRDGSTRLLVATDVAARGLDIDGLTHVVNVGVPTTTEAYVHRVGRVGRAGRTGTAVTVADPREERRLGGIARSAERSIDRRPLPSVDDIRARRVAALADRVRDAVVAGGTGDPGDTRSDSGDASESVIGSARTPSEEASAAADLLCDVDPTAALRAALTLLVDDTEVDDAPLSEPKLRSERPRRDKGDARGRNDRGHRQGRNTGRDRSGPKRPSGGDDTGFVYVGVGRRAGVRPGDLVGAVANEAGLPGSDIGPIRVHDRYSVVGVPEDAVDRVIKAMRNASVRGKRADVRRFVT